MKVLLAIDDSKFSQTAIGTLVAQANPKPKDWSRELVKDCAIQASRSQRPSRREIRRK